MSRKKKRWPLCGCVHVEVIGGTAFVRSCTRRVGHDDDHRGLDIQFSAEGKRKRLTLKQPREHLDKHGRWWGVRRAEVSASCSL